MKNIKLVKKVGTMCVVMDENGNQTTVNEELLNWSIFVGQVRLVDFDAFKILEKPQKKKFGTFVIDEIRNIHQRAYKNLY